MAHTRSDVERITREYLGDIWNERKYSKIPELVSESFVMYDPAAIEDEIPGLRGEVRGHDGLETFVRKVVAGFPDFHVAVLNLLSDDDMVMYEGRLSMTHTGDFYWIPPTGRHAEFRYMGAIRVADAAVQEHRVYPPLHEAAEQLGFTSPAIVPYLPKFAWRWLKHVTRSYR